MTGDRRQGIGKGEKGKVKGERGGRTPSRTRDSTVQSGLEFAVGRRNPAGSWPSLRIGPMKHLSMPQLKFSMAVVAAAIVASSFGANGAHAGQARGLAVAYPWSFQGGDKTSRKTARDTADEIARKAGFSTVPEDVARNAWRDGGFPKERFRDKPGENALEAFGTRLHANFVIFGDVRWDTRSIWVDLGPKTISTAKVDVYVFDVAANKVVFSQQGIQGRSDEPENAWKVAADILITPLVTVVSGGPATPREQRAVQIAMGRAYHHWVRDNH